MAQQIAHEMRMEGKHIAPATSPTKGLQPPILRPCAYGDQSYAVCASCYSLYDFLRSSCNGVAVEAVSVQSTHAGQPSQQAA